LSFATSKASIIIYSSEPIFPNDFNSLILASINYISCALYDAATSFKKLRLVSSAFDGD